MNAFDKLFEIAAGKGIQIEQFSVMHALYEYSLSREELIREVSEEILCNYRNSTTVDKVTNAITDCLMNKWIYELTPDNSRRFCDALSLETLPRCGDDAPDSSGLDLTPQGYSIYRSIRNEYSADGFVCHSFDCERNVTEVLGVLEEQCVNVAVRIMQDDSDGTLKYGYNNFPDRRVRSVNMSAPIAIGPWRRNRHEIMPNGWKIIIYYVVVDSP